MFLLDFQMSEQEILWENKRFLRYDLDVHNTSYNNVTLIKVHN